MLLERAYGFGHYLGASDLHIAEQVVYRISNGELVAEMHDVCVFRP